MGCPREKIHFSIYGADVKWSAIKPHFTKKIFLGIGRFTAKKAPQNTIRAFAEVVKTFPDAQLQLVGNGELLLLCQTIIKELGLSQNVQLLGNQTPEQIEGLMRNAIAFVQHSITPPDNDTEGSPLAVIEAGMAGLPVISTLHGGIPDIVIEGKTGFLVAENDIQAMAEKMKLLAADLDFAKKMGDNAALHIATNISIPICIEREWRIIERFL
jgi:glycosyltransferase involved in cell wall biosynthesis